MYLTQQGITTASGILLTTAAIPKSRPGACSKLLQRKDIGRIEIMN